MTDYMIITRTPRGAVSIQVLVDPSREWEKRYPAGMAKFALNPGEASAMSPTDIENLITVKGLSPEKALEFWRTSKVRR